jgi:hypothetical protein
MVPALVASLVLAPPLPSPLETLREVRKNYEALSSFKCRIVHHNSSGLFPGDFEQELSWETPAKFSLKVIKPSKAKVQAPNYTCDGRNVTSEGGKDAWNGTDPINTDPNHSPGWEVSGGLAMAWLMKTPSADYFMNPPAPIKLDYAWGKTTKWQGVPVSEVVGSIAVQSEKGTISLFLTPDRRYLVGYRYTQGKFGGHMRYADIQLDGKPLKL